MSERASERACVIMRCIPVYTRLRISYDGRLGNKKCASLNDNFLKIVLTTQTKPIHSFVNKTGFSPIICVILFGKKIKNKKGTEVKSYKNGKLSSKSHINFLPPTRLLSTVAVDFYGPTCVAILSASKYDGISTHPPPPHCPPELI